MMKTRLQKALFLGIVSLLTLGSFGSVAWGTRNLPRVDVTARLYPESHRVEGTAKIILPPVKTLQLVADPQVKIQGPRGHNGFFGPHEKSRTISLKFSASFPAPSSGNYIGPQGIVLSNAWFPQPKGLALYSLKVILPEKMLPVSAADKISSKGIGNSRSYTFSFPHPTNGMPLVAAPYRVYRAKTQGVTLAVYLLEKDENLAQRYLLAMAKYLKGYSQFIGPYPYKRLAAVVNPIMETGYAFPTFTLLGRHVIRLPFILTTSLPHEILHNWFGNGVYVKGGNWCEGLVSYLADQGMAAKRGEGWRYRHRALVNYQAYVTPDRDFPLIQFQGRYDPASQAIGYGKGSMVFHMLKKRLGDQAFYQALRRFYKKFLFKKAGWQEIEASMEQASNQNLKVFFSAWLKNRGVPRLKALVRTARGKEKGEYLVHITLTQEGPLFPVLVPLVVKTATGEKKITLKMDGQKAEAEIKTQGEPRRVIIDPNYDVMRRLAPSEYPPVVARVLGQGGYMVGGDSPLYAPLKAFLAQKGYKEVDPSLIIPQETQANLIFMGNPPQGFPYLFHPPTKGAGLYMEVQENPHHQEATVAWIVSSSPGEIQRFLPKLPHLGAYQVLATHHGRLIEKEKPSFQRGMIVTVKDKYVGVDLKGLLSLAQVARGVSPARVIFLGEEHPDYGQHLAQLNIIRWLVNHGHKVAIGMEAFQRPYQKALDQYLEGKLTLAQFLKKTEYYNRWGYDYKLYKPIIDYAQKQGLPIVALNIPKEITRKVAKEGLKSLTPQEKKEIPKHLDFSNESYRQYLKKVYQAHGKGLKDVKDFETFYQSQILWDEGMAQSIAEYLKKKPDTQMVVIVGKGHVAYGYGIPSRVEKRGIRPCAIVILGNDQDLDPDMGDYLLVPPYVEPPFSAKIGVIIKDEKGKGLLIKMVVPNTPAQRGGLKKGDIIVEADGKPVKGIVDLKAILLQKRPQDTVNIVVLRGKKRLSFTLGPFKEAAQHPSKKGTGFHKGFHKKGHPGTGAHSR